MKKNKKLRLNVETLRNMELDQAAAAGPGVGVSGISCFCESLECPTHLICTYPNTCNCA